MDLEKTRIFYSRITPRDLCGCAYCQNYIRRIRAAYPEAAAYLAGLGVDIEKPLETLPLEPDGSGSLEYAGAQYIVLGSPDDFTKTAVGPILADLAGAHPSTGVEEAHFVIELSPIRLKWATRDGAGPCGAPAAARTADWCGKTPVAFEECL